MTYDSGIKAYEARGWAYEIGVILLCPRQQLVAYGREVVNSDAKNVCSDGTRCAPPVPAAPRPQ
eukprot:96464-Rhodomonas_salina.3